MLLMKAWMETRWRLVAAAAMSFLVILVKFYNGGRAQLAGPEITWLLGFPLVWAAVILAGSGVRSQAPIAFPEGLAGSTQFTISLPVGRIRLLVVRAAFGLAATCILTVLAICTVWTLFPSTHPNATSADLVKFLLAAIMFLSGPYFATVLFFTVWDDPLPGMSTIWSMALLLWISRYLPPALNIFNACTLASPLITHRLPWSQMAASAGLALMLFLAAAHIVQHREY